MTECNQDPQELDNILVLNLFIRRPPSSIRNWWTDFPDEHIAKETVEQPFRIVTLKHTSNGKELKTYWRSPDGSERITRETMCVLKDGSWTFDIVHPIGLEIHDEFRAIPLKGGSRVEIRSMLIPGALGNESIILFRSKG